MANKTIDQYDLSSQLNDNDLFLIAKFNLNSNSYTAYNKVKYSTNFFEALSKYPLVI